MFMPKRMSLVSTAAPLGRILLRETSECFVQCQQVVGRRTLRSGEIVQRHALLAAAVFSTLFPSCAFDKDAAHGLGGGGEEMTAAIPIARGIANQAQVCLVDQGRGAECLTRLFLR